MKKAPKKVLLQYKVYENIFFNTRYKTTPKNDSHE